MILRDDPLRLRMELGPWQGRLRKGPGTGTQQQSSGLLSPLNPPRICLQSNYTSRDTYLPSLERHAYPHPWL